MFIEVAFIGFVFIGGAIGFCGESLIGVELEVWPPAVEYLVIFMLKYDVEGLLMMVVTAFVTITTVSGLEPGLHDWVPLLSVVHVMPGSQQSVPQGF